MCEFVCVCVCMAMCTVMAIQYHCSKTFSTHPGRSTGR